MSKCISVFALLLCVLIPVEVSYAQTGNPLTPPVDLNLNLPKNKFEFSQSHALGLNYVIENKQFYLNQNLLVLGIRPLQDKPHKATVIIGEKATDRDWVLEDGSRAIWVSGVSAPVSEIPIILAVRFEEKNDALRAQAFLVMRVVRDKKIALKIGEYVFYDLPGSKSNTCPIDLLGESVAIDYYDPFECVILQGVKPGKAVLKVFTQWWHSSRAEFLAEYELSVNE
ncbi:MAG: hypothetical protein EHM45_24200 [Desulfobacteraceae bacterium]|nr:MAG: hypothetical protein EHM45_24200 [Desulfobacteraceae bacterium]